MSRRATTEPAALVRHGPRICNGASIALALTAVTCAIPAGVDLLGDEALEDVARALQTAPGAEARIDTPSNDSYMVVYVPSDYSAEADWPLIMCYHGARGRPTTWPFRQATAGEGFIIAGLEYGTQTYASGLRHQNLRAEVAHFEAALAQLVVGVAEKRASHVQKTPLHQLRRAVLFVQLVDDRHGSVPLLGSDT